MRIVPLALAPGLLIKMRMPRPRFRGRTQQQPPTALRDSIHPTGLCQAAALAAENIAINAALQAMLIIGDSVEVKCQKALAVALTEAFAGVGEKVAQEALLVIRMRLAKEATEGFEGRQFGGREGMLYRRASRIKIIKRYARKAFDAQGSIQPKHQTRRCGLVTNCITVGILLTHD